MTLSTRSPLSTPSAHPTRIARSKRSTLVRNRVMLAAGAIACASVLTIVAGTTFAQDRRPDPAPQPTAVPAQTPPSPDPAAPGRAQPQAQPPAAPPADEGATNPGGGAGANPGANGANGVPAAGDDADEVRTIPGNGADGAAPPLSIISASRRPGGEAKFKLVANGAKVKEFVKFIAEVTGKSVIPRMTTIGETPITIVCDREVTKREALDLIIQAFRVNDIAVVENDRYIFIDNMASVMKLGPPPVLGPEIDVLSLNEDGQWIYKIFKIQNTKVDLLASRIVDLPDSASITPDPNSNQLIFFGDVATAKRVARIIQALDTAAYVDVQTKTFRLQWTDASQVANYISELFSARGTTGAGGGQPGGRQNQAQRPGQPAQRGGAGGGAGGAGGGELVGTSEQLLVSVIPSINSITVRAEPAVMHEIERLIATAWDVNPSSSGQIFKYYDLKYTDPLKVRDVLQALLESGGGGGGASRGGGRGGLGGGVAGRAQTGGGGESGADVAVANIFRIEAYPDSNRLLVISKTPDSFSWLDKMINDLDQPLQVGLPLNVPLKHANAVEMAEILNALLAPAGADATITAPETGLQGINFETAGGGTTGGTASTAGATGERSGATGTEIRFPWQSNRGAGGQGGDQTEVSAIVGKSRVVPNSNQNSLLVLATPEIQEALLKIISDLDVPGRQVMITAILAEVQLGDQLAYGLQFGPAGAINPSNPNNAIVITGAGGDTGRMYSGSREGDFIGDLTTSILSFGVDATVVLQALDQVTNVSILQQPRIFTSDNKEAIFFDGQDIPFQSAQANSGTAGGVTSEFTQIPVGIGVNVRPRITKERNVYMDIEVLLSNQNLTSPQGVGGNPVIDRRQTNTKVTIKNGQTIVISGIRKEQRNFKKTKVPFLGDIPVLDLVFAYTDDTTTTKELVIFITPVVVDNPDQNDMNFNVDERARLRELARPLNEKSEALVRSAGYKPKSDLPSGDDRPKDTHDPLAPIEPEPGGESASPSWPGQKPPAKPEVQPIPAPPAPPAPASSPASDPGPSDPAAGSRPPVSVPPSP